MRDLTIYGNDFYAQLFITDKVMSDHVNSVGINIATKQIMTEDSRLQGSFVGYSTCSYSVISYETFCKYLECARKDGCITIGRYQQLKTTDKDNLISCIEADILNNVHTKIINSTCNEEERIFRIDHHEAPISHELVFSNYKNIKVDMSTFSYLYINRYSLNQGWMVLLCQSNIGMRLTVIYSLDKINEYDTELKLNVYLNRYYTDFLIYSGQDVSDKILTRWEFNYVKYLLLQLDLENNLKPTITAAEHGPGCYGPCVLKLGFANNISLTSNINDDDKCGMDLYGLIRKLQKIAENKVKII